jgi:peptidoglycan/xylan/chitin deacetylase (PgdA/CDA1 family)
MKWWRQLRGLARATFHLSLAVLPVVGLVVSQTLAWKLVFGALALVGLGLLVRGAFIYMPGFDPFFRVPWRGSLRGRKMAITFDDGPNGEATEKVLELFQRYGGKATFFMIGENVEKQPDLARRVLDEGHAVGSHTYAHTKLSKVPHDVAVEAIDRGHQCLIDAGLPDSKLFRAPHGLKTFATVSHLDRRGIKMIAWTAGVYDTDQPRGDVIARRAVRWLRPGAILLLHDGKMGHDRRPMLEALETILVTCRERKLELVTVPDLLGA